MAEAVTVLEITDVAVRLTQGDIVRVSPGFALFEDRWVAVGEEAKQRFRLRPLNGNNTFWQQINLDRLSNASDLIQHSADLVYHHLVQLFAELSQSPLLVAYPGFLRDEQLSLLAGVCQSLQRPVSGLIDNALLLAAEFGTGNYQLVELCLHHALISDLQVEHQRVTKTAQRVITGVGWLQLQDTLVRAVSEEFIRQTRFNPRHDAEHEQTLYNELPQWFGALRAGESKLQVADQSITIGFNILTNATQRLLEPLIGELAQLQQPLPNSNRLLTASAGVLSQLLPYFAGCQVLTEHQVAASAQNFLEQIVVAENDSGIAVTECLIQDASNIKTSTATAALPTAKSSLSGPATIPAAVSASIPATAPASNPATILATIPANVPSHILIGHQAFAVGEFWLSALEPALQISAQTDTLCRIHLAEDRRVLVTPGDNCLLNGEKVVSVTELHAEDVLSNERVSYPMIKVVSGG